MSPRTVLLVVLFGSPAFSAPILVTGSGTFFHDNMDNLFSVNFSGSDGVNFVSVADPGDIGGVCCGFVNPAFGFPSGQGAINGQMFSQGFYTYFVGGGGGNASGFNSQHQLVVSQDLVGYVTITSQQCIVNGPFESCSGTFIIGAPEPATLPLTLAGLIVAMLVQVVRRRGVPGCSRGQG